LDLLVAAVRHHYRQAGRTSPEQADAAVDVRFNLARQGYRRWHARAGARPGTTRPLLVNDVRQVISQRPLSGDLPAVATARLLMIELDIDLAAVCQLLVADVSATALKVGGQALPLSCAARPGCTDLGCLACSLPSLAKGRDAAAPLVFGVVGQDATAVRRAEHRRLRAWAAHWSGVEYAGGRLTVPAKPVADARALIIATSVPGALLTLRLRAMLLLSWHLGLRGDDICRRLRRRDVSRTDRGYRVKLRSSKGDQRGKGQTLGIRPAAEAAMCPVAALDAWLQVVDLSSAEADRPLFCEVAPGGAILHPQNALEVKTWSDHLSRAAADAGLDGSFSSRSTRTGFAVTAASQGGTLEQIQQVLRHVEPETTLPYLKSARAKTASAAVADVLGRQR
jgi:integrase